MRFAPRTILGQLIAGSLLVQALVFAAFLFFNVRSDFRETRQRNLRRLQQQADTVAHVLSEPLATSDTGMLDHIMRAVPISQTIRGIRITDVDGKTLRVSNGAMPGSLDVREIALLPKLRAHPEYLRTENASGKDVGVEPIVSQSVLEGFAWVTPDEAVTLRYSTMALRSVALYAVFALLGNLLLIWWLSTSLARPLRQLRHATLQVRNNPNDLSVFPLPADTHNEAGELQGSFNAMVEEIGRQRQGTQETLSLLDAMLESAPVGFAFFDRDLRYVRLNETLARMNGLSVAEHLRKRLFDLYPSGADTALAEEAEAAFRKVFASGIAIPDYAFSGLAPGGTTPRTWQTSLFPVRAGGDEVRYVGVISTDVTERLQAQEAMRRSERMAAAGRLAASIAHEINNPLESVTNLLYLLQLEASLSPHAREYLTMAQGELQRVGEITQQTLKFYRRSTEATDIRLPEILHSVLVLHQARMKVPRIDVKLRFSEDAVSFGYPGELRQVFANLIGNAIDAMPSGGTLHVRARTARCRGKRGTRVTVADTGSGMPDAVRKRIFEPFFTTKETTGTGLGLWVSAEILEKHRAVLLVRSRESGRHRSGRSGTIFSIFFPNDGVPRGPIRVRPAAPADTANG